MQTIPVTFSGFPGCCFRYWLLVEFIVLCHPALYRSILCLHVLSCLIFQAGIIGSTLYEK
jgi:hypothetical protein